MTALKDIADKLKSMHAMPNKKFAAMIEDCVEAKSLMEQYDLNLLDMKYSLRNDLEFKLHKCPFCDEHLHVIDMHVGFQKSCKQHKKDLLTYINQHVSTEERARRMQVAKETNLKKYGAEFTFQANSVKDKIKQTNLERYGFENASKNEIVNAKTRETCMKKYGHVSSIMNKDIQDKAKVTLMKKYGTTNVMQLPEIKQKIIQTNLARYGTVYGVQCIEIQNKINAANLLHWGSKCSLQNDEIRNKADQALIEKYGENWRKVFAEKESKTLLDEAFQMILEQNKTDPVEFLGSRDEFLGRCSRFEYLWRCKECGKTFKGSFRNNCLFPICRECHPRQSGCSDMEKELLKFIKENYQGEIIENKKTIIKPYELDIYIPDLKLAFEFNGTYWHSTECKADTLYHLNKTKLCEEKGIHLIHIFEWEWEKNKDLVKQRIINILGANRSDRIFARKCVIREITYKEASSFINNHHLQGTAISSVNLGLFYKDELVAVMTFAKPRFNKQYQWELIRFCSSKPVIAAASRLLKYFETHYDPESLISYANRCWSSKLSNVYEKIGFKLIGESKPSYVYAKDNVTLPRYQCQKRLLKELLGEEKFDENLSETNNMLKNGYLKIYDCGNLVFSKKYKEEDKNAEEKDTQAQPIFELEKPGN